MKTIFTVLITAGLLLGVLRSDLTPWRIVNKTELAQPSRPPQVVERRVLVPVAPVVDHSGDWMHDPNYRSALEKTTIVGHPEQALSRDSKRPAPTPIRRP